MGKDQIAQLYSQPLLNIRQDSRGRLIEICKGKFAQCNILKMRKDSIWGKHYHKKTTECFYILAGEISVSLMALKNRKQSKRVFKKGDIFTIIPYTFHTLHVLKPTKCIVLYSHQFSKEHPDLHYAVLP